MQLLAKFPQRWLGGRLCAACGFQISLFARFSMRWQACSHGNHGCQLCQVEYHQTKSTREHALFVAASARIAALRSLLL